MIKFIRRFLKKESFGEKEIQPNQQDSEAWKIVAQAKKLGIQVDSMNIYDPDDPTEIIPGGEEKFRYLRELQKDIREIKRHKREVWLWFVAIAGFLMSFYTLIGKQIIGNIKSLLM